MIIIVIIISIYIMWAITSPLIAIFHELGHAIAFLILTEPKYVNMVIGSYDKNQKGICFKVGKLNLNIKKTFFIKAIGHCDTDQSEIEFSKYIIILLAGPLFSVFAAIILIYILLNYDVHGGFKFYFGSLVITSFMSLIVNLTLGALL